MCVSEMNSIYDKEHWVRELYKRGVLSIEDLVKEGLSREEAQRILESIFLERSHEVGYYQPPDRNFTLYTDICKLFKTIKKEYLEELLSFSNVRFIIKSILATKCVGR